jgi:CHAT domain-containing protein
MAMRGGYARGSGVELPRVVTISVTRAAGPAAGRFVVRLHEEGTPIAWRRDIVLRDTTMATFAGDLVILDDFSERLIQTKSRAMKAAERLGRRLFTTFVGKSGAEYLRQHRPTAVMIDVDERVLNLPWELMWDDEGPLTYRFPFGRIVTTSTQPKPERDPVGEDTTIAVLAVVDPTSEFRHVDEELNSLRRIEDLGALKLDVLQGADASSVALAGAVAKTPYDVVHFSSHGGFSNSRPGESGLLLSDGPLRTKQIVDLPWAKPPYIAVVSACWSGRAAPEQRLSSARAGSNGVAAAFLASGASSCLGFGWPVEVEAAADFVSTFYGSLVDNVNVGSAVLDARKALLDRFRERGDLAGLGAVYYGDAGTAQRRDVAHAKPPGRTEPTRRDIATAS